MSKLHSPPPPDTKVETPEEIADRIIQRHTNDQGQWITTPSLVRMSILSALRNEREACAKVAETAFTEFQTGHNAGKWIASAIREGR